MRKFQSFLSTLMESYVAFRKAGGCWNEVTYGANLYIFDRYCFEQHPNAIELSQEMVNGWCSQRATESNNSCRNRTAVVSSFVDYLRKRNKTSVEPPVLPKNEKCTYIPHAFADDELFNFFQACDNLQDTPRSIIILSRKITVPVFFRLLYSSGIRTNEARMLRVSDVNLVEGVLNIERSKGLAQHYIALHETMLVLMREYDTAIRELFPTREYFFPFRNGYTPLNRKWVQTNFSVARYKKNTTNATAYDLRHNYAVENINQWIGEGLDFNSKLLYLSKSMGHSKLESTKYYFHLVPALADVIDELSGQSFDEIVPEVEYEES